MKHILTLVFALMLCSRLSADSVTRHLYTSEELTSTSVNCIVQDRYGYIWTGTECGLNKFDGYHFEHFFTIGSDTTSISDNSITTLYIDRKGQLWIGTVNGLSRFNYHTNSFTRFRFPGNIMPRVSSITENARGLLIGTAGYGLFCIPEGKESIVRLTSRLKENSDDYFSRIHIDRKGFLWRGSHDPKLSRYKLEGNNKPVDEKSFSLTCGPTVGFLEKDDNTLLVVCLYGLMAYDMATGKLSDSGYDLSSLGKDVSIRFAQYDRQGNLYVCTSGDGLMKIAHGSRKLTQAYVGDNILSTANANAVLVDKDDNLWTTCYNKGLYKIDTKKQPFSFWSFAEHDILSGSGLSSIAKGNDGNLWCTIQNNGLYVVSPDGKTFSHPKSPAGVGLAYCDRKGRYWLCTEKSLYSYNPLTETSKLIATFDGWGLVAMADDDQDNLYISNFGKGFVKYNAGSGNVESFSMKQASTGKPFLWNDWILSMYVDSKGMLWIGTPKGVSRFDTSRGVFSRFKDRCLLRDINSTSFAENAQGDIFIGTDAGLYRYSYSSGTTSLVEASNRLEGRCINSIFAESNGDLWLGTSNGIWLYEAGKARMLKFTHGNGLRSREYRKGSAIQLSDGAIALGANDGITIFSPSTVRRNNINLGEVFLTRFVVNGRTADCLSDHFIIPFDENVFHIQFSLLDYRNVENITFEYQINDNGKWTAINEGENTIVFRRMIPGTYKLEVRAVSNGFVSCKNKIITITVKSPWYATTLAYIIYILLAVSALTAAFILYRRHKREELDEAKMQFLINATHDIRSPLTLIIEPLTQLKKIIGTGEGSDYIDTISHNAQRLLLLVNQILDERKIDKKQMHLHCSETEIIGYVRRSMKAFKYRAELRGIDLSLVTGLDGLKLWIDRVHFDKVVSNLLSNAFKYTPDGGSITVTINNDGNQASIAISDTGIGISEEKTEKLFERFYQGSSSRKVANAGTGIGLNLSRALVNLHGGRITAANRTDGVTGSVFTVTLPLGNAHLKPEEIETSETSEEKPSAARRQPSKNLRVMVVDDDEEIAQYIKNELSAIYHFSLFRNGKEALQALLGDTHYDIVVSDVIMPEMDGITLLRSIKSNPKTSDLPVILLTSKAEVSDRLEGLKRGADSFLAKPFSIEELQIHIDNLVDNYRRIRGKLSGMQEQGGNVTKPVVEGNDDVLMKRIVKAVNNHLSDPDFTVELLSDEVGLSRAQLHRKMKELTGLTTSEFIRNIRFEQAITLLKEGKINITQVAYAVGYNNQTHFSTVFKRQYGMTPSEYLAKKSNQ